MTHAAIDTTEPDWRSALGDWADALVQSGKAAPTALVSLSVIRSGLGRQAGAASPEIPLRRDDAGFLVLAVLDSQDWLIYPDYAAQEANDIARNVGMPPHVVGGDRPKAAGWTALANGPNTAPATVAPLAVPLLENLGLVTGGRWSDAAYATLWRKFCNMHKEGMPDAMPFFQQAIGPTIAKLPPHVSDTITQNLQITQQMIIDRQMRSYDRISDAPEDLLPAVIDLGSSLMFRIEEVFAQHWRLHEGWVAAAPLGLHDGLASHMAHAVVRRLNPDSDLARALNVADAQATDAARLAFLDMWSFGGQA